MGIQLILVTSHISGHLNNVREREREVFLLMEEESPGWRGVVNILNKHLWVADKK